MASEYTHVIQGQGKSGDWKAMTKHVGEADAKKSLAEIKSNPKGSGQKYRIVPFGSKPAATSASKSPAAKPAAKKAAPVKKK